MLNPTKVGGNVKMLGVNVKMLSKQWSTGSGADESTIVRLVVRLEVCWS